MEQRFELAQKAIETFHTGVTEDELLKNDQLRELRNRLLRSAAGFYRQLEGLLKEQVDEKSRRALGEAYFKLAYLTDRLGDQAQALEVYRRSLNLRQKLAEADPAVSQFQTDLARTHTNIGALLRETGRPGEALEAYQRALDIRQKLAEAEPAVAEHQSGLALVHNNIGVLLRMRGRPEEALEAHRRAMGLRRGVAEANPAVAEYQSDLALSHYNIGALLRMTGRPGEALEAHRRALDIRQKLASASPAVTDYQSDLARSHNNIGVLQSEAGRQGEALKEHRRALDIRQKLASASPAITRFQIDLAASHTNIGPLLREAGQAGDALKAHRRALDIQRGLAEANPAVTEYQSDLAAACCNLGHFRRDAGEPELSLPLYQEAIDRLRAVRKTQPRDPTVRQFLRNSHWGRAQALDQLRRHRDALADWEQVLSLASGPSRPFFQVRVAACLARCGEPAQAVEHAARLLAGPSVGNDLRYSAACVYALAARAAAAEASRPLPERQKRAEGYAGQAVALLRQAQQRGHFAAPRAVADMEKDDDLTSLRPRDDFRALLQDLAAKRPRDAAPPERLPMPRQQ